MFNDEWNVFVPRPGSKLKPFPCRTVWDFDFSFCFAVQRMCGVGLPFGCQTLFETGNLLVCGEGQSTSRTFWNFWSCPQCRRWSFLDFRVWNGAFWSVWPVDGHDEKLHVSLQCWMYGLECSRKVGQKSATRESTPEKFLQTWWKYIVKNNRKHKHRSAATRRSLIFMSHFGLHVFKTLQIPRNIANTIEKSCVFSGVATGAVAFLSWFSGFHSDIFSRKIEFDDGRPFLVLNWFSWTNTEL